MRWYLALALAWASGGAAAALGQPYNTIPGSESQLRRDCGRPAAGNASPCNQEANQPRGIDDELEFTDTDAKDAQTAVEELKKDPHDEKKLDDVADYLTKMVASIYQRAKMSKKETEEVMVGKKDAVEKMMRNTQKVAVELHEDHRYAAFAKDVFSYFPLGTNERRELTERVLARLEQIDGKLWKQQGC